MQADGKTAISPPALTTETLNRKVPMADTITTPNRVQFASASAIRYEAGQVSAELAIGRK